MFGGYVASTQSLGFTGAIYLKNTIDYRHLPRRLLRPDQGGGVRLHHRADGLLSTAFNSKGGAQGVGAATTNAVVSASILILAANYLLTNLFFSD